MTKQVHYTLIDGNTHRIDYVRTAYCVGSVLFVEVWDDDQESSHTMQINGVVDYEVR